MTFGNEDRFEEWITAGFLVMPCRPSRSGLVDEIARLRAELRHSRRELQHLRIDNEILRDAAESLIHHALWGSFSRIGSLAWGLAVAAGSVAGC